MTFRARNAVILLTIAWCLAGPATAGTFDDAMAASQRGDFATALRLWRPLAEHGKAAAQYDLGVMYHGGQGVPRDFGEALKWFLQAANGGVAAAQANLGTMYSSGHGVSQDYVQAYKWFDIAAAGFGSTDPDARDTVVGQRDLVASKMTAAQIDQAQRQAREWRPK